MADGEETAGSVPIEDVLHSPTTGPMAGKLIDRLAINASTLTATVVTLGATVTALSEQMNGFEGVRASLREIKQDLASISLEIDGAKRMFWRCLIFFAIVGVAAILLEPKIASLVFSGGIK